MVSKFEENANFSQVYEHVVVASVYLIGIRLWWCLLKEDKFDWVMRI